MKFIVQRRQRTSESVQGEMLLDGVHECFTLEPPYKTDGTKPRCIPAGTFDLTIRWSPHFNRLMPHVENVPDFTDIEIHPGNWPKNTDGCTLVGKIESENFVGQSVEEFNTLFQKIQDALLTGPQVITYVDPPALPADLDGEISV